MKGGAGRWVLGSVHGVAAVAAVVVSLLMVPYTALAFLGVLADDRCAEILDGASSAGRGGPSSWIPVTWDCAASDGASRSVPDWAATAGLYVPVLVLMVCAAYLAFLVITYGTRRRADEPDQGTLFDE
jgi:hypothetical protein